MFKLKPELSVRHLPQIDYTCFVGLDVTPVLLICNFTLHHTTSFQTNVNCSPISYFSCSCLITTQKLGPLALLSASTR